MESLVTVGLEIGRPPLVWNIAESQQHSSSGVDPGCAVLQSWVGSCQGHETMSRVLQNAMAACTVVSQNK